MSNYANICPDASLVIRLLLNAQENTPIEALWRGWYQANANLVAPTLLFYEVSNALHRYVVHQQLTGDEVNAALDAALQLGIHTYGDAALHKRALSMAQELGLPATYDAHYLALAERMGAQFWTADRRLFNTVKDKLGWINLWS